MVKDMPLNRIWGDIAQDASNYIWTAAPWRWTIGVLTPITLTAAVQQFTVGTPPTDFLRLEQCYTSDGASLNRVQPVSSLPGSATLTRIPSYVAISGITNSTPSQIRFDSLFPPIAAGTTPKFWAWYKKIIPDIANNLSLSGALVMDDDYYQIYREWVLYYAYRYADDQRAGGATVTVNAQGDRQLSYSGQLAVARAALEELRREELVLYDFPLTPSPIKNQG